jgi:tetratricopeptide (TPR) repeat protein
MAVLARLPLGVPVGITLIAAAVFAAYLPSINGGFVLDDGLLLTENKDVAESEGLYRIWCTALAQDYWPVSNTSFWIEWRLWGMNPAGYHATNLILHIVESILIWIVLRRLAMPGAFLAATLFAVHPVNVEAVAWIAQRKDMSAMLFFLLAIHWYLKAAVPARSHGEPREGEKLARLRLAAKLETNHYPPSTVHCLPSTVHCPLPTAHYSFWYLLSLAAFVMAMLGKGSAAILPVVLWGIAWWLQTERTSSAKIGAPASGAASKLREQAPGLNNEHDVYYPKFSGSLSAIRRELWRVAPFFLVAAALTMVNVWMRTKGTNIEFRHAGFADRLVGAGGVIWFYLYKALLPVGLCFIYPQWSIEAGNPLWWAPLVAALAVTAVLWRYRKTWGRALLFAWGFFCIGLAPALGFVDVAFMKFSLVADHYQHIAIIGVIALVCAGLGLWRGSLRGKASRAAAFVAAAGVAVLIFLTWRQSALYRDEFTLYRDTLKKNPQCWPAQNDLGIAMVRAGRFQEAIDCFRRVLQIKSDHIGARSNLGNTLYQIGRFDEALEQINLVLTSMPDYAAAHYNMGLILSGMGRRQEAFERFQEAVRLNPDFAEARCCLGNILFEKGRIQEAIEHYRQAVRSKPDFYGARNSLGYALTIAGRPEEAIEHLRRAVALKDDFAEAWYNLGNAHKALRQFQQAEEAYRRAVALKPDYVEAHNNLGIALFQTDRPDEAVEQFNQVLRLRPEDINAYNNLASAYAGMGRSGEAVAAARKALELARAQGRPALAEQIEKWLNAYRSGLFAEPNGQPAGKDRPRP